MHRSIQVQRPRLALLTNILTPYRVPLYNLLGNHLETRVILSGSEDNRRWTFDLSGATFSVASAKGLSIKSMEHGSTKGRVRDIHFFHINPGYITELMRWRPDAIMSTEMGFRSLIALLYGAVSRVPVWLLWEGTPVSEQKIGLVRRLLRRNFFARFSRHWVTFGDEAIDYLISIGVTRASIVQVQNTVDEAIFRSVASPVSLDLAHPRVLFVGQLIERKGLRLLLAAAAALKEEGIRFSVVVIGDGPESSSLQQAARDLRLSDIVWIKHVEADQMSGYYRACDLLVLPTLEDVWGLVVNEALLCGLPVLASQYAGAASELLPASNVFDPHNPDEFVSVLRSALVEGLEAADSSTVMPLRDVASAILKDIDANLACP